MILILPTKIQLVNSLTTTLRNVKAQAYYSRINHAMRHPENLDVLEAIQKLCPKALDEGKVRKRQRFDLENRPTKPYFCGGTNQHHIILVCTECFYEILTPFLFSTNSSAIPQPGRSSRTPTASRNPSVRWMPTPNLRLWRKQTPKGENRAGAGPGGVGFQHFFGDGPVKSLKKLFELLYLTIIFILITSILATWIWRTFCQKTEQKFRERQVWRGRALSESGKNDALCVFWLTSLKINLFDGWPPSLN